MTCQSNDSNAEDTPILASLKIAAPCNADWDTMVGTERERFCSSCALNVYNISSMSSLEAERFLAERAGSKVCVQFFRRKDGTILSDNCPKGLRAMRDRSKQILRIASSFVALLVSNFAAALANEPAKAKPINSNASSSASHVERGEPSLKTDGPPEQRLMGKPSMDSRTSNIVSPMPRKEQLQKKVAELEAKPHGSEAAKLELANAYIELAHSQNSCNNFKQSASDFSQAAKLLKKMKSQKQLYANVLLNQAAALKRDNRASEAKALEEEAAKLSKNK
jgi:hypothetical protein